MNEYRKKYPNKARANFAIGNAIKAGKIIKPSNCELCGKKTIIYGHHSNYEERLKVLWVCPQCHKNIHCPLETRKQRIYIRKPVYKEFHKKFQPAPKRDKLLNIAQELRKKGIYYQDIAKELGITIGTAYKWLNEVKYD